MEESRKASDDGTRPHERLVEWLRAQPESQTATAFRLGCSANYLSRIAHGRATPGRKIANAIESATADWRGGQILASEWDLDLETAATAAREAASR